MPEDRPSQPDDAALVRDVADGSEAALGMLYDRHAESIYAAASRLTSDRQMAEEVVQETFLALWNRAELFDPRAGSLAAWLHTIARNRTVDRLRATGRRPTLVPFASTIGGVENDEGAFERLAARSTVIGGANHGPGPEGEIEALEVQATIRTALSEMPDPERLVIVLAYRDELSQSEIAERLGWPLGTVKTRTRRALHRLREVLGDEFGTALRPTVAPLAGGKGTSE